MQTYEREKEMTPEESRDDQECSERSRQCVAQSENKGDAE